MRPSNQWHVQTKALDAHEMDAKQPRRRRRFESGEGGVFGSYSPVFRFVLLFKFVQAIVESNNGNGEQACKLIDEHRHPCKWVWEKRMVVYVICSLNLREFVLGLGVGVYHAGVCARVGWICECGSKGCVYMRVLG